MRPQYVLFLAIILIAAAGMLHGCPTPPVTPHAEATISEGGGTLTLGDAAIEVAADALPSAVLVELSKDAAGETVERDENETPISGVYTLTNDQDVVVDSADEPFKITLPFDSTGIAKDAAMEAKVFVKMATDEDCFTLVGAIEGNTIMIELIGLPYDANFQVVYNPNGEFIMEDEPVAAKRLTGASPWQTYKWVLHADATNSQIRAAVGAALGIPAANVTGEQVRALIKDRVGRNARELSAMYSGMKLREPNIPIRTREDGQKRFVLNLTSEHNAFSPTVNEDGIGQLNIGCETMAWGPTYRLGTIRGVIAHELFHGCVNGYDLKMGRTTLRRKVFKGYNEGMATVMGHTFDKDAGIAVRENTETRDYSFILDNPLGIPDAGRPAYSNHDFFAYVGKKYGGESLAYLIGTGTDGDGYLTGVLDQMRKYLNADDLLLSWASEADSYLVAYRKALHNALVLEFGESLGSVYWDFARNRAYENNAESRLRGGDPATRWQLRNERFDTNGIFEYTFAGDDENVEFSYTSIPTLNSIEPFSTCALVFNAGSFDADLTLTFDTQNWFEDDYGNSVRAEVYKSGEDGTEVTAADSDITLSHFGGSFDQVVVLISNVSVDGPVSIILNARTQPTNTGSEFCSPLDQYLQNALWLMQWDLDCDSVFEDDILWQFNPNGTISRFFIVIPGSSWSVIDDRIIISFPEHPIYGQMEADFSEDCNRMENGASELGRCWKAERW